jgi:hypothetical protein
MLPWTASTSSSKTVDSDGRSGAPSARLRIGILEPCRITGWMVVMPAHDAAGGRRVASQSERHETPPNSVQTWLTPSDEG